jgi:hypothetical protein
MKKLIIISIFILASFESYAKCDLKNIGINKKFNEINKKYNLDSDFVGTDFYSKNIRGKAICKELNGTEVSLYFIDDKLAQIEIFLKSDSKKLFEAAINSYGEADRMPNEKGIEASNFVTRWQDKKSIITYKNKREAETKEILETLTIQSEKLSDEFFEVYSPNEKE